jgi:hypothetical protein
MDSQLGEQALVHEFSLVEETEQPYRELLDPCDAAELLVTHAIVPLCDEGLHERVMRNAERIAEHARVLRLGEPRASAAPMAWQSPQMQSGFAPPAGSV